MFLSQMSSITVHHYTTTFKICELIEFDDVLTTCFQLNIEPNTFCTYTKNFFAQTKIQNGLFTLDLGFRFTLCW